MPWRGISNLLALLIVLTIVIGIAIVASDIVSNILMKMEPKGTDLVPVGFVWWWGEKEDDSLVIYVRGVVHNIGKETINITDMRLSYGGKEYHLDFKKFRLKPNKFSEVHARAIISKLPEHSPVTVFIKWCTAKKCSISFVSAQVSDIDYLVREEYYTITIPVPVDGEPTSTVTITLTETVTATVPMTTTTITSTQTVTTTYTTTMTQTQTVTTTTTVVQNKPTWPVVWTACYDISDNIYVSGALLEPVSNKESIPYVVKYLECGLLGCRILAVKPFEWVSKSSFESKYYLPDPQPFRTYKIEIWSVDWEKGRFIDKVYEQTIDTSVRCA